MQTQIKKISFVVIIALLLASCYPNKKETLQDFLAASNQFDKQKTQKLLADNFTYIDNNHKSFDKSEYLSLQDSLHQREYRTKIVTIQNQDSIIKTEEEITNMIDSLLEVTPKIIQQKTYHFNKGKLTNISVDSVINYVDYVSDLNEKVTPFTYYIQYKHDIKDKKEILKHLKKYLIEFYGLSATEKKKYKIISYLQGTFTSDDNYAYPKLAFKGKKTVVIYLVGLWPFTTSYVVDDEYIRIRGDNHGDILLRVEDSKTLIGEGAAAGTYKKVK